MMSAIDPKHTHHFLRHLKLKADRFPYVLIPPRLDSTFSGSLYRLIKALFYSYLTPNIQAKENYKRSLGFIINC